MGRSGAAALGTLLLLTCAPITSQAKTGSSTAFSELSTAQKKKRRKKAKRYSKKGKKAYAKGKYDDAIVAFELAYDRAPDPRYLFNIGRCHHKLGDLFKAMEFTQRYAAKAQEGEEKEDAEEMVAMLRAKLVKTSGEVAIDTAPTGATVSLTGKGQSYAGPSPLIRWLLAGRWKVEVTHPGHVPQTKEFSVGIGQSSKLVFELLSEAASAAAERKATAEAMASLRVPTAQAKVLEPAPEPRSETGSATAPSPGKGPSALTWVSAGVAVVAAAAGLTLSAQVSDKLKDRDALLAAKEAGGRSEASALEEDATSLALMSNAAFAAGGVALTAALLTWHFDL